MTIFQRSVRGGAAAAMVLVLGACSSLGSLGNVLGSVLGGGNGNEVAGIIQGVDTRNQQISLQQSNGQNVALQFDNQTKVVYQNRNYSVTSLEYGDQVSARVQQLQNGGYYTDSVMVTQPASGSGSSTTTGSQNVQSLTGTVRQVDRNNGLFTIDVGNGSILTVSLAYNASSSDVNRFNSLRTGDNVRFYGVYLNNSRVELRQFY
jgi:Cu/Ag efflux protein CusF